jgi:trehalose/maltose transport system substrate-binding protein
MTMNLRAALRSSTLAATAVLGSAAAAEEITYVSGAVGNAVANFDALVAPWEERTGHDVVLVPMPASTSDQFGQYRLWLAAQNGDIDIYQTDVIWAPQLAEHFVDLTEVAADLIPQHFESVIQSQTVNGQLVALPDLHRRAGALLPHRPPGEARARGAHDLGRAHRDGAVHPGRRARRGQRRDLGLRVAGQRLRGPDLRRARVDQVPRRRADRRARRHHLGQQRAGGRGAGHGRRLGGHHLARGRAGLPGGGGPRAWQTGNAVFMRNWPYAYLLGNGEDSAVAGLFDVAPLPMGEGEGATSAATLGGWNVAVSRYGDNQEIAIDFALYVASAEAQKQRAINEGNLPTIQALYEDADVLAANPYMARWQDVFLNAVPRPSAPTQQNYNEVSTLFFTAVHSVISGEAEAAEALADLEADLEDVLE